MKRNGFIFFTVILLLGCSTYAQSDYSSVGSEKQRLWATNQVEDTARWAEQAITNSNFQQVVDRLQKLDGERSAYFKKLRSESALELLADGISDSKQVTREKIQSNAEHIDAENARYAEFFRTYLLYALLARDLSSLKEDAEKNIHDRAFSYYFKNNLEQRKQIILDVERKLSECSFEISAEFSSWILPLKKASMDSYDKFIEQEKEWADEDGRIALLKEIYIPSKTQEKTPIGLRDRERLELIKAAYIKTFGEIPENIPAAIQNHAIDELSKKYAYEEGFVVRLTAKVEKYYARSPVIEPEHTYVDELNEVEFKTISYSDVVDQKSEIVLCAKIKGNSSYYSKPDHLRDAKFLEGRTYIRDAPTITVVKCEIIDDPKTGVVIKTL